eukprot:3500330-Lingulodinium_polyedra.AAC.1
MGSPVQDCWMTPCRYGHGTPGGRAGTHAQHLTAFNVRPAKASTSLSTRQVGAKCCCSTLANKSSMKAR